MTKPQILSLKEARRLAITSQALGSSNPFGSGRQAVGRAIDHLGYVQIDTISVVNRAHHHVIWSRVPVYTPKHLLELQVRDRTVFEYWSHAAAYLPISDYRYSLPLKRFFKDKKDRWPKSSPQLKKEILNAVRENGPARARDFEDTRETKGGQWWEWKPAKRALERLFLEGDLMVSHREGFQKVYDIPERILPPDLDTSFPDTSEYARYLIMRTLKAHGLALPAEMCYQRQGMKKHVDSELAGLLEAGEIVKVQIRDIQDRLYYALPGHLENLATRMKRKIKFLSPFDNLVIQRNRVASLFGFEYQIECYVPKPKRKYGYFSLPVLYGDTFIGRMDTKVDRKDKVLHVNNLVFEDCVGKSDKLLSDLTTSLSQFASFQSAEKVIFHQVTPVSFKEVLRQNH